MRCPFCHSAGREGIEQCPECGFSLAEVQRVFGVPSGLEPGLNDRQRIFSRGERKSVARALEAFQRKFPQCRFSIVTESCPSPELPLVVYGFWLFNTSGICRKLDRAGDNHDLLLVIDADAGQACLLIGYGLEPFVGPETIAGILEAANDELADGRWLAAVRLIVSQAGTCLAAACSALDRTFGIDIQKIYEADKERRGELIRKGEY